MTANRLKRPLILLLVCLIALCAMPSASSAADAPSPYTVLERAEVKRESYPGALTVGEVLPGTRVFGYARDGEMLQIAFEGMKAWIPFSAVTEPESEAELESEAEPEKAAENGKLMARCLSKDAKMLLGGTSGEVVGTIPQNALVEVLTLGQAWHMVEYDGVTGWVRESQLKLFGALTFPDESEPATYKPIKGKSDYLVVINIQTQIGTVLEKDSDGYYTVHVRSFPVSSGRSYNTPYGTYDISDQYRWQLMKGGVYTQYASRFTGAFLLHSVPYSRRDAATLLTKEYNKLGDVASSGCVRMRVVDCKWIYDNCPAGTIVQILKDGTHPCLPVAVPFETIESDQRWDPTDPDPKNPFYTGE